MNKQNLLGLSFVLSVALFVFGIVAYDIGLCQAAIVFITATVLAVVFGGGIYLMSKS